MKALFVSAQANLRVAKVKARRAGRSQNEHRTRQAIRGMCDMFRKDGLLK
ncbi:MAG: hypothetical protein ACK4TK_05520 [Thiobacillaceae bacterium]